MLALNLFEIIIGFGPFAMVQTCHAGIIKRFHRPFFVNEVGFGFFTAGAPSQYQ